MKKLICLLLVVLLLCGCSKNKDEVKTPVDFYYINAEIHYDSPAGVISAEVRDSTGYKDNLVGLLDLYLAGPSSDEFISPFPNGTVTMRAIRDETTVNIELSKAFAGLKGLDLTIACACLTRTVSELTGCSAVKIYVADTMLEGNDSITMDANEIILLDEVD